MNESQSSDPTLPGSPAVTGGRPSRRPYPFLAPAEGPGELGRLGGYRVLRLLGTGGMGFVFEAEELTLRRRVALKVLRPELCADPSNRERFLREARAAAAVASDHVVTIYQIADSDPPYLAMQFLEGQSLQSRIEKPPPITLRTALEIARQTAEGLAAAHAVGLTHRDIKPANLWLEAKPEARGPKPARTAEKGAGWNVADPDAEMSLESSSAVALPHTTFRVKILDFGLARRASGETSLTSTGFIVGTPNFMAPEQAAGSEVDGRADIFSLGCVLYTILVGELPFQGSSAMAVMMALANFQPPLVSERNPAIPVDVAEFVARLLEKDQARRPQSAREVVDAIDALLLRFSGNIPLPGRADNNTTQNRLGGDTIAPGHSATLPPSPSPLPQPAAPPSASHATRRESRWVKLALGLTVLAGLAYGVWGLLHTAPPGDRGPIVVGILHSQTGTMAVSEEPVIHATLLAIDEINAKGGVLGRQIKAVVANGDSKPEVFARQADKLLEEEKAVAIFGCWTSDGRKTVKDVLYHRNEGLLFYPVQYEGLGQSPRIIYLGPGPNQQLIPAIDFLTRPVEQGGLGKKRLYLVGSDYVFPRVAHEIIRDQVKLKEANGVSIVGEMFLPLGSKVVKPVVTDIDRTRPDAIVNTINGGTNLHFFEELRKQKITPEAVPTISLSITENEVMGLHPPALAGDYLAASYFQSIDRPESREFLRRLRERYGQREMATDPMAAAYTGVYLWAKAVEKAGTTEAMAVRDALRGMEFDGVRCHVKIDAENLHAWLPARIGKIRPDGLVDLVPRGGTEELIRPVPFPPTRSTGEWDQYLRSLQLKWDGRWQAPGKK